MLIRWLTSLTFLSFGLLSLTLLQLSKRPLCIDSKVVERVDSLSGTEVQSVYRCNLNKNVPFSEYFHVNLKNWTYRVQQIERILESIEPFYRKVQLTILKDKPYYFKIQGHQIFIGEQLVEAPGHLERALIKIWYRERNQAFFAQQDLMEDVVTDFVLFMESGDVDIGDPLTRVKTALNRVKWPYVIKSVAAYCESPWKKSEHFEICQNKEEATTYLEDKVIEPSLRPLAVTSWVNAFKSLSGKERFLFLQTLAQLLRSEHSPFLPLTLPPHDLGENENALSKAAAALKNVSAFVSTSSAMKSSETHRIFVSNFTNELRKNGFHDAFVEANFDVLYVSREPLVDKNSSLQQFLKISKENPTIQIAVRDQENLWMLPSRHPVPLRSFGQLKAHRTVVEKCGGYNFSYVIDYAEKTEKLLVVDHCDAKKEILYGQFIRDGIQGFAAQNKNITFVQFHLPSLLMKKSDLAEVPNVLDFIKKRDVESTSFRSLGWREVQWSKQADAYQPKAYVDAIEWFRITQ